jgi:folylpolyglutamate synthase/dihydropteroate synthase
MIRAGLEGAGLRVHAYTSPHLVRFHERIRLAGDLIEEDRLSDILDRCLAANGPTRSPISRSPPPPPSSPSPKPRPT